jgi:3-isopropylmalate/(R)-2-methylmalate dehydratase small subunit
MNTIIKGKIWVVKDQKRNPINNIDTDQIFHNAHLAVTEIEKMGQFAFGNLKGWEDFPKKAGKGDILAVGENFGAGSSRQQAVDCFISLGIAAVTGESFGEIYRRNAINSGFPIMTCASIMSSDFVETGDIVEIDLVKGAIKNLTRNCEIPSAVPASQIQLQIMQAGSLLAFGK